MQANTSVAGLFANLNAPLSEFVVHNAGRQTYDRFDPDDPTSADVAVRSLKAGQAVWALVQPNAAWLPAPPSKPRQVTIRLSTGANLISWQGPDRDIDDALNNVAHLSYAYQYDAYTQHVALLVRRRTRLPQLTDHAQERRRSLHRRPRRLSLDATPLIPSPVPASRGDRLPTVYALQPERVPA